MLRLMSGCITALVLAGQASVQAETLAELYEKAKAEKEVVFYSGGPAAPHENRAKLFMQQFPGIEVKVTGGFSNVLNEQIEKQMAEKKLEVDMAFFQTVQDFVALEEARQAVAVQAGRLRPGAAELPRRRRRLHGAVRQRADLCLQHRGGQARGCAEVGAGFPQADVRRQDDHRLSGRRRRHALSVPSHRAEVRLGLDGQIHGQQAELRAGPPAGRTQRRRPARTS